MGSASYCDRCKAIGVQLVPVLGADLCNECVAEFQEWVSSGRRRRNQRIVARGQWATKLERLARDRGVITPDDVAKAFCVPRPQAHWQLNYHTRVTRVLTAVGQARFAAATKGAAE